MTTSVPTTAPMDASDIEEGVAAEVIVGKIAQSGDLGRAMVERAYYVALSEKLAAQIAELRQASPGETGE